jgi:MFS family permease
MNITGTDGHDRTGLLLVLLMAVFIANVDVTVVNVATHSIRERLNASDTALQLVVSGYTLAYAMLLITGARLGAMYGYRRLFVIGLGVFTVASLACGLASSAAELIVARVVQGAGAALLVPQVLTGIQLSFSGPSRIRAIGYHALAISIGAGAGQLLGGILVSADLFGSGWRAIFLINVPVGAGVMIAALRFLPMHRGGETQKLDLVGLFTLSSAVLLGVLPLILGASQHWPVWTWTSLIASVVPFVAFILVERRIVKRNGYPLINLDLLSRPAIGWGLAAYGAALSTYFALLFTLALYLQEGLAKSALYSGLALLSWVIAFGIGGLAVSRAPVRFAGFAAPVGFLLVFASYCTFSLLLFALHASDLSLFVVLGFGGLGMGIGITAAIRGLTAAVPLRYAPDMSGLIAMTAQISGFAGVSIFGALYFGIVQRAGSGRAMHAFGIVTAAFAVTAVFAVVASYRSTRVSPMKQKDVPLLSA